MTVLILVLFGLCLGSFINALVFRLHAQSKKVKGLSIVSGRSICPNCKHQLAAQDLLPVFSWLLLKGKCRYCKKPISWQYPFVELSTAVLFVISYLFFPSSLLTPLSFIFFFLWLAISVLLIALLVYDLKWMLLPNRLVFPFIGLSAAHLLIALTISQSPAKLFLNTVLSLAAGAGIFYVLFQVSNGRWIGGGDVKLAIGYGLLLTDPLKSLLVLFIGSIIGSIIALPRLINRKLTLKARVPFGPMLITALIIVYLWGDRLISWYKTYLLLI